MSWATHKKRVCGSPRPIHTPHTRRPHTRHRTHTAHGRRAPTSPPSAAWALCRLLSRIPSAMPAEEAHAKREKPDLKAKGADRKA